LSTNGQQRYDLSSLRRVTVSTEALDHDLAKTIIERTGCQLENYYGTTECNMISWTAPGDSLDVVANTVGKPAPGAEIRIVDEDRKPLSPGEIGEIAAKTAQMMSGYHLQPELTAEVLDEQGWFYTGDRGYLDRRGYLHITGRIKDIIIRGGENIAAVEIESFLATHAAVHRAGVIGVPHGLAGEAIWAFVQLNPGSALTERQLLAYCDGQIAPFKIPDRIHFVERLPTTATGKLQKYKLREMAPQER
jgi:acyl-coenzyme A synthetase/AMP-(fatty) acid ligase